MVETLERTAILLLFGFGVFGVMYHQSKRFLEWLRFQSIGTRDYIVERLGMMFIEVNPQTVLLSLFGFSGALGLLGFLAFLPNWDIGLLFGLLMMFFGWKIPKPVISWMYRRRVSQFVLQMVDGLGLMSNGLRSGLSIIQALDMVAQQMPNPMHQEFALILSQNKVGVSVEDAFLNLSKRIESDDVEMFVTSVNILKETGGNLAETFDTIVTTIRERIRVEKKIEAMTAQQFWQGMMLLAVPPVMGLVFFQADPEFMMPLFETTYGAMILLGVLGLEVIAVFAILKIIKIDV